MNKRSMVVFVIAVLMMVAVFAGQGYSSYVYAKSNNNLEEKVYCSATIEDEFAEDSVIVVLGKNIK